MKIAVIRPGYHELDHQFCRSLADLGHTIDLFIPDFGEVDIKRDLNEKLNYKVFRLKSFLQIKSMPICLGLLTSLGKTKYNLIISNEHFQPNSFFSYIISKIKNIKFIIINERYIDSVHTLPRILFRIYDLIIGKHITLNCDKIIFHTNRSKTYLCKKMNFNKDFISNKTTLITLGVDISEPNIDKLSYKDGDTIKILFIGRLIIHKNIINLLRTLRNLIDNSVQNWSLEIVGDGPQKKEIQLEIDRLKLNSYIKMHGHIKHEMIKAKYLNSHIFILPSIREVAGAVILEALSLGVPTIVTDIGGMVDFIKEGETGFIINPINLTNDLLKIFTGIQNGTIDLNKMSIKAKDNTKIEFSNEVIAKKYDEIFKLI